MALTYDQVRAAIFHLYDSATPHSAWSYASFREDLTIDFNSLTASGVPPETILQQLIEGVVGGINMAYNKMGDPTRPDTPFPGINVNTTNALDDVTPQQLLDHIYGTTLTAAQKQSFITTLDREGIDNAAWLSALALEGQKAGTKTPSVAVVLDTARELQPEPNLDWPALSLNFPGVTDHALDFLVAIYLGSFQRAPEHDGLKYWASEVARLQADGLSGHDALVGVTGMIYDAGGGPNNPNPEIGYNLTNLAYVNHIYQNVLGREADGEGRLYWLKELSEGTPRNVLLHTMLDAALKPDNSDAGYLEARIIVARYVAQENITGPGKPATDLRGVIEGVSNPVNAHAAVEKLLAGGFGGSGKSAKSLDAELSEDVATALPASLAWLWGEADEVAEAAPAPAANAQDITLVGVAATPEWAV